MDIDIFYRAGNGTVCRVVIFRLNLAIGGDRADQIGPDGFSDADRQALPGKIPDHEKKYNQQYRCAEPENAMIEGFFANFCHSRTDCQYIGLTEKSFEIKK